MALDMVGVIIRETIFLNRIYMERIVNYQWLVMDVSFDKYMKLSIKENKANKCRVNMDKVSLQWWW